MLSKRKKKNYKNVLQLSDIPNTQIKINVNFETTEICSEVLNAMLSAIDFFNPENITHFQHVQQVGTRKLRAKSQKISLVNRIVGLYLWDEVNILGKRLLEVVMDLTLNNKVLNNVGGPKSENSAANKLAKLIYERHAEGDTLNSESLTREYRLADACVHSLSVLSHGGGKNKPLSRSDVANSHE